MTDKKRGGWKLTAEQKNRRSEAMKAKWQDPEYRSNVASGRGAYNPSDETRKKISDAKTGKSLSAEHKKVLSEKSKKLWESEEYRKKVVDSLARQDVKERMVNPDANRKKSKAKTEYWSKKTKEERLEILTPTIKAGAAGAKTKLKGRKISSETQKKMLESRQKSNPQTREKRAKATSESWARLDPSVKAERIKKLHLTVGAKMGATFIEKIVMDALDRLGIDYAPQYPIGRYIADIYIPERKLVIECDGYYWHSRPADVERDRLRDKWMTDEGYSVVRLTGASILKGAIELVERALGIDPKQEQ